MMRNFSIPVTATLATVCAGTVYGWITTSLSRLMAADSPIIVTSDQSSWIASLTGVGSMFGPFVGAVSADTFGRKKTLLLTSFFYLTGWLINIFATRVEELYAARVILGIGIGISYTTIPLYISEIADLNIRGALSTLITVNGFAGSLFACSIGPFVSIKTLSIILLIIPFIFLCLFVWFPESPYYLVSKERYDEAAKSLVFLKGIPNPQEAKIELEIVILNIKKNTDSHNWSDKFRDMLLPNNRKALGIVVFLQITSLMSGYNTTMAYLKVFFQKSQIGTNPSLVTVIVLVVGLFSCALATVTIEKVGRRRLLLTSTLGTCVTLTLFATYLIENENGVDMSSVKWLPVLVIILFQLTFQFGIGSVPDALIGELFPTNVKSIASATVGIVDGVFGIAVVKMYQIIGDAMGQYVIYYIFAGSCFFAFLFTLAFIPETMNKEFDEIQKDLAHSKPRT